MLHGLAHLLTPSTCAACEDAAAGGALSSLCPACAATLPRWPWPVFDTPAHLRSAWFLGPYEGPLGAVIRRGKYVPDERAVRDLGAALGQAARGRLPAVDVVVPVPQRPLASLRRGFAPTAILARAVSRALGVPLQRALRRRGGAPQAGLDVEARKVNVATAFDAPRPLGVRRALLVDDVITTGATASACAAELLNAGATEVHLLALCGARM
ncbi:MAG: ComF family protein [Alphaproteobacteria bacterium]|nr:ComF family protein [Alphaproteobacteria bacterium]